MTGGVMSLWNLAEVCSRCRVKSCFGSIAYRIVVFRLFHLVLHLPGSDNHFILPQMRRPQQSEITDPPRRESAPATEPAAALQEGIGK